MKKSKIVSYTSEELKQMSSQSDWAAADAMTDEEIEAAIASDPEEASMHEGWLERAKARRRKARFVMCISNEGHEANLTLRRVYKVIPDASAEQRKMIKIVDDTGEAYLFSTSHFVPVELSDESAHRFEMVTA